MGENLKKTPCSGFTILPTIQFVCLFVCFTDRLANFKSQDIKIFRHAQYPDDYGLVQPVGPRLVQ